MQTEANFINFIVKITVLFQFWLGWFWGWYFTLLRRKSFVKIRMDESMAINKPLFITLCLLKIHTVENPHWGCAELLLYSQKKQLNVLGDYIAIVTTSYICRWASLSPEDLWGFGGLVTWASKKYTKVHLDRAPPRRQHLWTLLVQAFSPLVKSLVNPYLFWANRVWEYNIQRDNG